MGLLDDMMSKASTALAGADLANSPLAGQAMDVLKNNQYGGLSGLVQAFHDKGLGGVVSSWIGTGANLPISAEQIQSVLGNEQVKAMAAKAGIPIDMLQQGLATVLPQVIDKLTPNGQLPKSL